MPARSVCLVTLSLSEAGNWKIDGPHCDYGDPPHWQPPTMQSGMVRPPAANSWNHGSHREKRIIATDGSHKDGVTALGVAMTHGSLAMNQSNDIIRILDACAGSCFKHGEGRM